MTRFQSIHRILATLVAVVVLATGTALAAKGGKGGGDPSYNIIKLDDVDGSLEGLAYDINESRLIVGHVRDPLSAEEPLARAAYWTVTQKRRSVESTLHFLDAGDFTSTSAHGCNDVGEIVGSGDGVPLYWAHREAATVPLPTPTGSLYGSTTAISNDGVICGWANLPSSPNASQEPDTALVWRVTEGGVWGPLVLGSDPETEYSVEASSVSDHVDGVVTIAGSSNGNPVTWTVTLAEDGGLVLNSTSILPSNGGLASGLNNLGMVCGRSAPDDAVVWIDGIPLTLERESPPLYSGFPYDINDDGVICGRSLAWAVVWSSPDAAMVRLDKYLKNSPLDSLTSANAVSESGEIVGYGWISDTGLYAAFLAIPK